MSLLEIRDLTIDFAGEENTFRAVHGISFDMEDGETLAIVGESGSGKSVTALSLAKLLPPEPICKVGGQILFDGKNLATMSQKEIRPYRGKTFAYIFQEPSTSLNPVLSVGFQVEEAVRLHQPLIRNPKAEVVRLLEQVGIVDAARRASDYPHQLSGGMQQRVMIAMALACKPRILVADEPTTALDVTIQAQILDLLKSLKKQLGMGVILITHNFGVVSGFADRVLVMFRGKIVEYGKTEDVLKNPQHAYTKALLACVPRLGERKTRLTTIDYAQL